MKEINDQLRTQLQLRDEYLDVELRRKDHFMEETIKLGLVIEPLSSGLGLGSARKARLELGS